MASESRFTRALLSSHLDALTASAAEQFLSLHTQSPCLTPCPRCGENVPVGHLEPDELTGVLTGEFTCDMCGFCSTIYVVPRQEERLT